MTWSEEQFWSKAHRYVERGLDADDEGVRAWWFHFAVEPLVRATVAKVHPAILAHPRSLPSLLSAVGHSTADEQVIQSRAITEILEIARQIGCFDAEAKDAAARLTLRRNIECHGPNAAFENIGEDEWMPDFLRVASACCATLAIELSDLVGEGYAEHAAQVAADSQRAAEDEAKKRIAEAKARPPRKAAPSPDWQMVERTSGEVMWVQKCPACDRTGVMTGRRVHVGSPRLDGSELTQLVTIAGSQFACPSCELVLTGRHQLATAGLPATVRTSDHLDPYDTLYLDPAEEAEARGLQVVDPSDFLYQDE